MPTNNKSENLGLNQWLATDKPKREDFVNDNHILDSIISQHFNNAEIHLSSEDRANLGSAFVYGTFSGDGEESRAYTLPLAPRFILVYLKNQPPAKYDATNAYTLCNCGFALSGSVSSIGISLSGTKLNLTQSQSASNGVFINLNKYLSQYAYIAFK